MALLEDAGERARLAMETIAQRPTRGVPTMWLHVMEHALIERLAGARPGAYRDDPVGVYLAMQEAVGTCMIDQFIPENPLTMGERGYEGAERGPTTGAHAVVVDGMAIDSPEAVVEHLERFEWPRLRSAIAAFDQQRRAEEILAGEAAIQQRFGRDMLKGGYGFVHFPCLRYTTYGYANYFMAYALYGEVMEADFALQADLALLQNRSAGRAYVDGQLPPVYRLDHDMADSRGTLVDIRSLERIWFPHFSRCIRPLVDAGVRLLWHCDGNLTAMVEPLLESGVGGFQGFQYECGMDYEAICRLKAADGRDLLIVAGVSVTRTLPHGSPADVRRELAWLAEQGPPTGLFLGVSSSVVPGTPWENIHALVEGLRHYREKGSGTFSAEAARPCTRPKAP